MSAVPDWMRPPREEGWLADDLDNVPEAPRHTELIDGALVFMMSPQRTWHGRVILSLWQNLDRQAPDGVNVETEMTIRLDEHNRPEPDVVATTAALDADRTWHAPEDVLLVIEVVSPESEHRDRTVKHRKYAEAGIPGYWRVEDEGGVAVVHAYELDSVTGAYVATGIFREDLKLDRPFHVEFDVRKLFP